MDGGGELREVRLEVLGGRETGASSGARPGDREEGAGDEGRVGAGGVDDAVEEAGRRVGEGGGEGSEEEPVDEHDKTCCARRHTAASSESQHASPGGGRHAGRGLIGCDAMREKRDEASSFGLA